MVKSVNKPEIIMIAIICPSNAGRERVGSKGEAIVTISDIKTNRVKIEDH